MGRVGYLMAATGMIHGINSSLGVLTMSWGMTCWLISLLLGINWVFRKQLFSATSWLYYHRVLTIQFWIVFMMHMREASTATVAMGAVTP